MSNSQRRKILKSITAGTGAVVAGKGVSESWQQPVIDSVFLPAHGQSTAPAIEPSINCEMRTAEGLVVDDGAFVSFGEVLTITFTITPNSGAPYTGTIQNLCNGAPVGGDNFQSDANGVYSINFTVGNTCGAVGTESALLTVEGVSSTCSWMLPTAGSDRNIKQNFAGIDEQQILEKVAALPIESWSYTDREHGIRHIGPMAQDFKAAFKVGDSERHIHLVDANGVAMAAIKALYQRMEEKDARIDALQDQVNILTGRLDQPT